MDNKLITTKPKIFITTISPFTENMYKRMQLEYLKDYYDIWVLDCLDLFLPKQKDEITFSLFNSSNINLEEVSTREEIISLINDQKPIFLLDSIGKSEYTFLIQSICKSNKLCYVYDVSINSIGSSSLKNNFLYFLSILPRKTTKIIAYLICCIRDTKYIRPDIVLSSSSTGSLWELSARKRILTVNQSFINSFELESEDKNNKLDNKSFILFLDDCLLHSFDFKLGHKKINLSKKDYFNSLDIFFNKLESQFNMPVIIAAHPNGLEYKNYEELFTHRKVIFNKSLALSKNCFFAMTHYSLSIHYPIYFKKQVIFLELNELSDDIKSLQKNYTKSLGSKIYNIQESSSKVILKKVNHKKYNKFINSYLNNPTIKILHQYSPLISYFKS